MSSNLNLVPLCELIVAQTNVRAKAYNEEGLCRLADQIVAKGRILDPLKGARLSKKRVGVHDGGRRLAALQLLKAQGRLPDGLSKGIPVIFDDDDRVSQIETSIMSNERENFSPIEESRAFSVLAGEGVEITNIANRFGLPERVVRQRLALANVHPTIVEAFEANFIDLARLQAFTLVADQEIQLRVFSSLGRYAGAREIRRMLTDTELPITSSLVSFVGLQAYRDAGGDVREDLFDDDASVCCNPDLVRSLAVARLELHAAKLAETGWKWVEVHLESSYELLEGFARIYPTPPTLTDERKSQLAALCNERVATLEEIEALDDALLDASEPTDGQMAAVQGLEARLTTTESSIEGLQRATFTDEQKARAGVVVFVRNGALGATEGLIRQQDVAPSGIDGEMGNDENAAKGPSPADKSLVIAKGLAEDLNLALQVGVQAAIAKDDATAFLVSTAWLASSVLRTLPRDSALVSAANQQFRSSVAIPVDAEVGLADQLAHWSERLLCGTDIIVELSSWKPSEIRALHSFCAAMLYSRQEIASSGGVSGSHARIRELVGYEPRADLHMTSQVLARFTRTQLFKILSELAPETDAPANAKKPELVALAVKHVADWLPAQVTDDDAFMRLLAMPDGADAQ